MNIKTFNEKNPLLKTFEKLYLDENTKVYERDGKTAYRTICPFCGMGGSMKARIKKDYSFEVTEDLAFCYYCKKASDSFDLAFVISGFEKKSDFLDYIDPKAKEEKEKDKKQKEDKKKKVMDLIDSQKDDTI